MAVKASSSSVTMTANVAVKLAAADPSRISLSIGSISGSIYVGDPSISLSTGIPVESGTVITLEGLSSQAELWGISVVNAVVGILAITV